MGFDHADARPCIRASSYTAIPAASAFEANVERRSYSRAGVAIPGSLDGWPHSPRRKPSSSAATIGVWEEVADPWRRCVDGFESAARQRSLAVAAKRLRASHRRPSGPAVDVATLRLGPLVRPKTELVRPWPIRAHWALPTLACQWLLTRRVAQPIVSGAHWEQRPDAVSRRAYRSGKSASASGRLRRLRVQAHTVY